MFGELLESRAKPVRNRGGAVASVVGHALMIGLAVVATRGQLNARRPVERVITLPVLHPAPRAPMETVPARSPTTSTPSLPGAPKFIFPDIILPGIPPIDVTQTSVPGIEWRSDRPGDPTGTATRTPGGSGDGIPFAGGVDKPAIALAGNPSPRYPEILRRANVRGEVVVQIVIDTTGLADMATLRIVSSDHPLLTDAVVAALPRARFLPAETGGRKVRMWAVQSFVFDIERQ
jgi:protein TonB